MPGHWQVLSLTPADGALYRLARAIAAQAPRPQNEAPPAFADLVRTLCRMEAGEREVDAAQVSELLADLREALAADPQGVLEVLADKVV